MKKYEIIYTDPPWDYKGQRQHGGQKHPDTGGASTHYKTMTVDDMIKKFKPMMAKMTSENCLLFMWSSSPHLDQAIKLGEGWGFDYATIAFVWYKKKPNPGFYTMSECEIVLVFKKKGGKIPGPRGSRSERQFLAEERREHSRKPDEIRQRINRMFPSQRKLEMFARVRPKGWDVYGNQTSKFKNT